MGPQAANTGKTGVFGTFSVDGTSLPPGYFVHRGCCQLTLAALNRKREFLVRGHEQSLLKRMAGEHLFLVEVTLAFITHSLFALDCPPAGDNVIGGIGTQ